TQAPKHERMRLALAEEAAGWPTVGVGARALAAFYLYTGWAYWDWGERLRGEEVFSRLRDLPGRFRDPFVTQYSIFAEGAPAAIAGRLEETVEIGKRVIALADESGSPVFGRLCAPNIAFRALLHLGRAEEALALLPLAWQAAGLAEEPANT